MAHSVLIYLRLLLAVTISQNVLVWVEVDRFEEYLSRIFIEYFSIRICLMLFRWLDCRVMGFGEEDHRAKVPFSLHPIKMPSFPKIPVPLEPQDVTWFGNMVFADVMRLRWGHMGYSGLWSSNQCPLRRENRDTEAEIGSMLPEAKRCQQLPKARKAPWSRCSLSPREATSPVSSCILDFWPSALWENTLLLVYATSYSTPRDILKYILWAWFTTADVNLGHWAEAVFARFLCYEVTVSSSTHTHPSVVCSLEGSPCAQSHCTLKIN